LASHLRLRPPDASEAWSYNVLQRLAYLAVVFVLFPLMVWTGLAMSPAVTSVFPGAMGIFGGQQSARTLHFLGFALLFGFLIVHVTMVYLAGFKRRMRAMITGRFDRERQ
jgi:thiosulfate reductase cytochrome b subunit